MSVSYTHLNPYSQSQAPILEQKEAVGHAVRAGYMYAGIADVAALTKDCLLYTSETSFILFSYRLPAKYSSLFTKSPESPVFILSLIHILVRMCLLPK